MYLMKHAKNAIIYATLLFEKCGFYPINQSETAYERVYKGNYTRITLNKNGDVYISSSRNSRFGISKINPDIMLAIVARIEEIRNEQSNADIGQA